MVCERSRDKHKSHRYKYRGRGGPKRKARAQANARAALKEHHRKKALKPAILYVLTMWYGAWRRSHYQKVVKYWLDQLKDGDHMLAVDSHGGASFGAHGNMTVFSEAQQDRKRCGQQKTTTSVWGRQRLAVGPPGPLECAALLRALSRHRALVRNFDYAVKITGKYRVRNLAVHIEECAMKKPDLILQFRCSASAISQNTEIVCARSSLIEEVYTILDEMETEKDKTTGRYHEEYLRTAIRKYGWATEILPKLEIPSEWRVERSCGPPLKWL